MREEKREKKRGSLQRQSTDLATNLPTPAHSPLSDRFDQVWYGERDIFSFFSQVIVVPFFSTMTDDERYIDIESDTSVSNINNSKIISRMIPYFAWNLIKRTSFCRMTTFQIRNWLTTSLTTCNIILRYVLFRFFLLLIIRSE